MCVLCDAVCDVVDMCVYVCDVCDMKNVNVVFSCVSLMGVICVFETTNMYHML